MVNIRVSARHRSAVMEGVIAALVLVGLLASTVIIYFTDGTAGQFNALAHLYYIPIVAAALSFGPVAGVLSAVAAAVLGGPMMPADVAAHVMQPPSDWVTRAFFFVLVGVTVGGLTAQLRSALTAERRQRDQLSQFGYETLTAFTEAVAQRDLYTGGHVKRIAGYATAVARELKLSLEQVDTIGYAAQLHDIGKLAIPTEILRKPSYLSREEWDIIQQHPVIGSQILERISVLRGVVPLVRHHHERFDGTGYPDGLRGSEIPLGARIIAVVDAFDAMISDRPYRCAMSFEEAIDELRVGAGTQFDPGVVNVLLRILRRDGHRGIARDSVGSLLIPWPDGPAVSDVVKNNGQRYVDVE